MKERDNVKNFANKKLIPIIAVILVVAIIGVATVLVINNNKRLAKNNEGTSSEAGNIGTTSQTAGDEQNGEGGSGESGSEGEEGSGETGESGEGENLTPVPSSWDLSRVNVVRDNSEDKIPVPVPKGYTASSIADECVVNTGFVIYEGTTPVTDENKTEAQTTRNQWVWVPVSNVNDIYGTDSNGKMWGKLYNYSATGRTANNWTETNGTMSLQNINNYREPDLLTYQQYDRDNYVQTYITEEERNEINKNLTKNFERIVASIKKYGGFYVGRYETGDLSKTAKVVRGNNDISSQTWYKMYQKSLHLNGTNKYTKTIMIYGSLWDATLEWLEKSGAKTYQQIANYGWGNHTGTKRPTGYSESWKANNIYDMEGNVYDWTAEAYGTYIRVCRGGYYGNYYSVSNRDSGYPSYSDSYVGSRAALYVAL